MLSSFLLTSYICPRRVFELMGKKEATKRKRSQATNESEDEHRQPEQVGPFVLVYSHPRDMYNHKGKLTCGLVSPTGAFPKKAIRSSPILCSCHGWCQALSTHFTTDLLAYRLASHRVEACRPGPRSSPPPLSSWTSR